MTGALTMDGRVRVGEHVVEVAIEVADGETVAVLGPNGAGKTTLLRALAGLVPLDSGSVHLDGRTLDGLAPEERSIGMVFQDLLLFEHLDVRANVAFGPRSDRRRRREADNVADTWLARLGIASLAEASIRTLSGGEAQRVALARALAAAPRALLLDEPLAALDAEVRGTVRRDLRDHLQAHAGPCVIVTHDLVDAAILADRILILEAGRITAAGSVEELVAHPRTPWAAELAGTNLLAADASGPALHLQAGGTLVGADGPGDGPVLVAVRPSAITLHRRRPSGSARNVWRAEVLEVEPMGDRVRVRLGGEVPMVAEVTAAAIGDLSIENGATVWASLKATDLRAYPA